MSTMNADNRPETSTSRPPSFAMTVSPAEFQITSAPCWWSVWAGDRMYTAIGTTFAAPVHSRLEWVRRRCGRRETVRWKSGVGGNQGASSSSIASPSSSSSSSFSPPVQNSYIRFQGVFSTDDHIEHVYEADPLPNGLNMVKRRIEANHQDWLARKAADKKATTGGPSLSFSCMSPSAATASSSTSSRNANYDEMTLNKAMDAPEDSLLSRCATHCSASDVFANRNCTKPERRRTKDDKYAATPATSTYPASPSSSSVMTLGPRSGSSDFSDDEIVSRALPGVAAGMLKTGTTAAEATETTIAAGQAKNWASSCTSVSHDSTTGPSDTEEEDSHSSSSWTSSSTTTTTSTPFIIRPEGAVAGAADHLHDFFSTSAIAAEDPQRAGGAGGVRLTGRSEERKVEQAQTRIFACSRSSLSWEEQVEAATATPTGCSTGNASTAATCDESSFFHLTPQSEFTSRAGMGAVTDVTETRNDDDEVESDSDCSGLITLSRLFLRRRQAKFAGAVVEDLAPARDLDRSQHRQNEEPDETNKYLFTPAASYIDVRFHFCLRFIQITNAGFLTALNLSMATINVIAAPVVYLSQLFMLVFLNIPDAWLPMHKCARHSLHILPRQNGRGTNSGVGLLATESKPLRAEFVFPTGGAGRGNAVASTSSSASSATSPSSMTVSKRSEMNNNKSPSPTMKSRISGGNKLTLQEKLSAEAGKTGPVFLYLNGGSYCLMHPGMCRHFTHRVAVEMNAPVFAPYYRKVHEDFFDHCWGWCSTLLLFLWAVLRRFLQEVCGAVRLRRMPSGSGVWDRVVLRAVAEAEGLGAARKPRTTILDSVNDAARAFLYLVEECRIDAQRIIFIGESAGGGLSALALLKLKQISHTELLEWRTIRPGGALLQSPWVSLPRTQRFSSLHGVDSVNYCVESTVVDDIISRHSAGVVGHLISRTLFSSEQEKRGFLASCKNREFSAPLERGIRATGAAASDPHVVDEVERLRMACDPRCSALFADFREIEVPIFVSTASNECLRDDQIDFAFKVREDYGEGAESLVALEVQDGTFHAFQVWLSMAAHPLCKLVLWRGLDFLQKHNKKLLMTNRDEEKER